MATTLGEVVPEPTNPSSPLSPTETLASPTNSTGEGVLGTSSQSVAGQEPGAEGSTAIESSQNLAVADGGETPAEPNSAAQTEAQQNEELKL